jgi:hypothetical protein
VILADLVEPVGMTENTTPTTTWGKPNSRVTSRHLLLHQEQMPADRRRNITLEMMGVFENGA